MMPILCGKQVLLKSFFVIIVFVLSSNIAVSSGVSKNGRSLSSESVQNQQLQDYIEKEILTDGTTLESLLQIEENVRNGISTASETKHHLLSKTRNFLANKIADHLLNQHEMGLKSKSPDNGLDATTEGCRGQLDSWMKQCVFD